MNYKIDEKAADEYLAANELKVRTSRDKIEKFDKKKIERALIVETGAPKHIAKKIASEIWKELKNLGLTM